MAATAQHLLETHHCMAPADAISALQQLCEDSQPAPETAVNIASALLSYEQVETADQLIKQLLETHPNFGPGWARQSEILLKKGRAEQALEAARKGTSLNPTDEFCRLCLGIALKAVGRVSEATIALAQCLNVATPKAAAFSHYGLALSQQGRHAMALDALSRARTLEPDNSQHASNWLMTQQYLPQASSAELKSAALEFGRSQVSAASLPITAIAGKPQIGIISSDLYHHPVGLFLLPVLRAAAMLPGQIPWRLYHDSPRCDAVTEDLKRSAANYIQTGHLNDTQLAEQISADGTQVLIELNGHSALNRLAAMAQRLSPVQLSWLGYPASTGLNSIDGVLIGQDHLNSATPGYFVEPIIPLPGCHLLYPLDNSSAATQARQPGPIRLGCFNNSAKINSMVLDAWAAVMQRLPSATLLLKWRSFSDPEYRRHLQSQMKIRGIEPTRITFEGHTPHADMMGRYRDVDIALDTFPFNGGLTTCEALSMGTPVVSMAWSRPVSRQGAAILNALGHPEWVTETRQQYVSAAADLASDTHRLEELRSRLPIELFDYQERQAPRLAASINEHSARLLAGMATDATSVQA